MARDYYEAIRTRRTVYSLSKKSSISDKRLEEVLGEAVKHSPTPFNNQAGRIVLLLGAKHEAFWDATKETLRALVPEAAFAQTEAKLDGFRGGYGTVLFFEDQSIVKDHQERFALYKDYFPVWSGNATGMLQNVVWTSLAVEGMGASLQHYNPLVDTWVEANAGVPKSWKLTAEMPFGVSTAEAGPKDFLPLESRFKVLR